MISGSVKAVLAHNLLLWSHKFSRNLVSRQINWNAEVPRGNYVMSQVGVNEQSTLPALGSYKDQTGEKGASSGQACKRSKKNLIFHSSMFRNIT